MDLWSPFSRPLSLGMVPNQVVSTPSPPVLGTFVNNQKTFLTLKTRARGATGVQWEVVNLLLRTAYGKGLLGQKGSDAELEDLRVLVS